MSGISRINRLLPHIKLHPTQLNTYCEVEDIILHELNDLPYLSMMNGWELNSNVRGNTGISCSLRCFHLKQKSW